MSWQHYITWWIKAKDKYDKLINYDEFLRTKYKAIKDRVLANDLVGGLYAKYSMLVQELDTCLDQLCQPQKRVTIQKLVDSSVMRLKELYEELKDIDVSEYHYIDGSLVELKLIPHQVEIIHPTMFFDRPIEIKDLIDRIKRGERIYTPTEEPVLLDDEPVVEKAASESRKSKVVFTSETTAQSGPGSPEITPEQQAEQEAAQAAAQAAAEERRKKKRSKSKSVHFLQEMAILSPEEEEKRKKQEIFKGIVLLFQKHERASQARLYFNDLNRDFLMKKAMIGKKPPRAKSLSEKTAAAIDIQRVWRGHCDRKVLRKQELKRRRIIGMIEPLYKTNEAYEIFEKNLEKRRELRYQRIREYIQSELDEKDRILRVVAPGLFEDISEEIREWFYQWYLRAKNFDKYPEDAQGGTIIVIRGDTFTPEEWIDEVERLRKSKGKDKDKAKAKQDALKAKKAEKEKKKKQKAERKKYLAAKKKRKADMKNFEYQFDENPSYNFYKSANAEYRQLWSKRNDFENPEERHYQDIITDRVCYENQLEVRKKVDELMRLELELLLNAIEIDRARAKGRKPKPRKPPKPKKEPKAKKGPKDMTKNRTTEDLFQELVDNGIIRQYPYTRISEYWGDFSYANYDLRNNYMDPPGTINDVRQAVVMHCIYPMGVDAMPKPKSVIIAGPKYTGKHLLANAIFTETRCVLFDISPEVTAGKYLGKKGQNMFVHLVMKMAKLLQPSIIFVDGAEKPFYKKVPPEEEEYDPKRLGKILVNKIVKPIKSKDRVMVLAISEKPYDGGGKMKKAYDKAILIPAPDYGSVYLWWRSMLLAYHGIDRNINLSCLTKLTMGYTYVQIRDCVKKVLCPERLVQLQYRPLQVSELYEEFVDELENGPISEKEMKKLQKWFSKYPTPKLRKKLNQVNNVMLIIAQQQKEKEKQIKAAKKK